MTKLVLTDKHYWGPIQEVLCLLESRYGGGRVLDVGPGHAPLPWATDTVDFVEVPGVRNFIKCDLTREPLPFPDKTFDFVFCRHLLEDSWNPFPVCAEMQRVGKAGYIETPSPVAEMCRGVDGASPPYRGYFHHRFIVWAHAGELRFVSKYPLVEYLQFDEDKLSFLLRSGPKYWNTYYLWTDEIRANHRQAPLDFEITRDYGTLLRDAVGQSMAATDAFWCQIPGSGTVPNLLK